MIKNILNVEGVDKLSRQQQSSIMGGVDKCCLKPPTNGFADEGEGECPPGKKPCNTSPTCTHAHCHCNNSGPCW